jgi:hypothetical protein
MNNYHLIYPMTAMVGLTFVVFICLFLARIQGIKKKQVSISFYKLYQGQENNEKATKLSRNFSNIFETPNLFYIACLVAMQGEQITKTFYLCAWLYVGIRTLHSYIHIGKNEINPRFAVYLISWLVLVVMWLQLMPILGV